jgi:hypothetical protein
MTDGVLSSVQVKYQMGNSFARSGEWVPGGGLVPL